MHHRSFYYIPIQRYTKAAATPPAAGPKTGIHAYHQALLPFPFMGNKACIILGPRSRAGLIAYPVGPPKLIPIPKTNSATGKASKEPKDMGSSDILPPAI